MASVFGPGLLAACTAFLLATAAAPRAATLEIIDVKTSKSNRMLVAAPELEVAFSEGMVDALESGVRLTIDIDLEIIRPVRYWLDDVVTHVRHSYAIELHALSARFVVTDTARAQQWTFPSLEDVIDFLKNPPAMPFAEADLIAGEQGYAGRLRARLDVESLPAPLRPVAYLSPSWWMASDWVEWTIEP